MVLCAGQDCYVHGVIDRHFHVAAAVNSVGESGEDRMPFVSLFSLKILLDEPVCEFFRRIRSGEGWCGKCNQEKKRGDVSDAIPPYPSIFPSKYVIPLDGFGRSKTAI